MSESQREAMTQLGLIGLIPFAATAVGVWLSPWLLPGGVSYDLTQIALIYAAVVASYIVGVGAGGGLSGGGATLAYRQSGLIAALVAWITAWPPGAMFISLPDIVRFAIIMLTFFYLLINDRRAVAAGALPQWYGALRVRLTFWTCLMLAAIITRLLI